MSLKKFIFFLVEIDGRSRQIVNGVVTSLSQPKQLSQAPDGNQEIAIGWERSQTLHGNVRMFALPFGYVMEAATILRNDFYKFNLDRVLFLLVKRLTYEWTTTTFKEYYKQIYKGQLDWASAEDDQGNFRFNIGLLEAGLQKQMKANEGTEYEIPFDIDAKNVRMDGLFIAGTFKWYVAPYESLAGGYPGIFQLNNDNRIPGLAIFDVQMTVEPSPVAPTIANLEYFAETTQDIANVHVTGLLTDFNSLGAPGALSVILYVFNVPTNTVRLGINLTPDDPYPEHYNLIIDETFDLLEGDRLYLRSNSHFEGEGNLQLAAKSKPVASTIKGFTLFDLGMKLVEKMTGSSANFESDFLQLKNIIITSGDGIRSIENATIKTTWRDYWKAVDVYTKAQCTITDKVRIGPRLEAYNPAKAPISLGITKAFKVTPAIDYMWTSIKVGHKEPQTDDTNGKFDFNSVMILTTGIEAIPDKQLDLQSPYKASPWEIEQTRANYDGKTTTDKETDNDVYALAVLPDPAGDSFESTATFQADGTPFAPGQPLVNLVAPSPVIQAGMKLRFVGSVLNTNDYTVAFATSWFFGQLITLNEPLVNETIVVTVQILEGQYYILDRTPVINQLIVPIDVDQETKDSVYNVPLSPKRIFNLHKGWIAGGCYGYAPGSIKFASNDRNKELIADGIIEKANVPIADLGDPDFIPKYMEFDTLTPVNMTETLEADTNPNMEPEWQDNKYIGFFLRGGIALNDLEEQTFKLLVAPGNNLLNLI